MNNFKYHLLRPLPAQLYQVNNYVVFHEALCIMKLRKKSAIHPSDYYTRNINEVNCELCLRLFKLELFS